MSKYGVISGPYFPVFRLHIGKYVPELCSWTIFTQCTGCEVSDDFLGILPYFTEQFFCRTAINSWFFYCILRDKYCNVGNSDDWLKLRNRRNSFRFFKIDVLKNFANFTGKYLRPATLLKREPKKCVFFWNLIFFKNTFFYRNPPVAASKRSLQL